MFFFFRRGGVFFFFFFLGGGDLSGAVPVYFFHWAFAIWFCFLLL